MNTAGEQKVSDGHEGDPVTPEDPETQNLCQESGVATAGLERGRVGRARCSRRRSPRRHRPHCHLWKQGREAGSPEGP